MSNTTPPLTPREEHAAALIASGKVKRTGTALRMAGISRTRTTRARFRPGGDLHAAVARWANDHKLSIPDIVAVHAEQLHATKLVAVRADLEDGAQGMVEETVPDNQARIKAVELGYRVHGVIGPEREDAADNERKPARVVAIQFNVIHKSETPVAPTNGKGVTAGLVIGVKPGNGNGTNGAPHG